MHAITVRSGKQLQEPKATQEEKGERLVKDKGKELMEEKDDLVQKDRGRDKQ